MYIKKYGSNGLRLVASEMPSMSSVSLGVWIGAGGRYETEELSGVSHLVEHMLFKGTARRDAKELKQAVEGVGGSFNGFTSDEVTCYMVKVPARHLELGLDILSDMVINPRMDTKELSREKYVVCEEIKMYRDQPGNHVLDVLGSIMWPGNPLGRPLTGSISTVRSMTREDLVRYKERHYHSANTAVVAAGNFRSARFFSAASKAFSGLKRRKLRPFKSPRLAQRSPRMSIRKGETKQAHIAMGFHANVASVRERFAIKMMNVILGGNMSSRLFEELREKYGLCYDISSSYKRHSDVGEVQIHAGVDNRKAATSVTAIIDELRRLRDLGVTDEELERAKEYAKGQFLLAMEGTSTRMLWLGDRLMVHREIPEVSDVLRLIDSVGADDITRVCSEVFRPSGLNVAMIGALDAKDRRKIKKEMGSL